MEGLMGKGEEGEERGKEGEFVERGEVRRGEGREKRSSAVSCSVLAIASDFSVKKKLRMILIQDKCNLF